MKTETVEKHSEGQTEITTSAYGSSSKQKL